MGANNTSFYLSEPTGSRIRILSRLMHQSLSVVLNMAAREYVEKYADDVKQFEELEQAATAQIRRKAIAQMYKRLEIRAINATAIFGFLDGNEVFGLDVAKVDVPAVIEFLKKIFGNLDGGEIEVLEPVQNAAYIKIGDKLFSKDFTDCKTAEKVHELVRGIYYGVARTLPYGAGDE